MATLESLLTGRLDRPTEYKSIENTLDFVDSINSQPIDLNPRPKNVPEKSLRLLGYYLGTGPEISRSYLVNNYFRLVGEDSDKKGHRQAVHELFRLALQYLHHESPEYIKNRFPLESLGLNKVKNDIHYAIDAYNRGERLSDIKHEVEGDVWKRLRRYIKAQRRLIYQDITNPDLETEDIQKAFSKMQFADFESFSRQIDPPILLLTSLAHRVGRQVYPKKVPDFKRIVESHGTPVGTIVQPEKNKNGGKYHFIRTVDITAEMLNELANDERLKGYKAYRGERAKFSYFSQVPMLRNTQHLL